MKTLNGLFICLIFLGSSVKSDGLELNRFIKHYEPLSYDRYQVHEAHGRAKRSVSGPHSTVSLKFNAHDRHFHLRLKRDLDTFADDLTVVDTHDIPIKKLDASHVYKGHLVGEPNSIVFGSLLDGVFEGKIVSPKTGAYYVEKSSRYFPTEDGTPNTTFHSIVYRDVDVHHPHDDESGLPAGCGITGRVREWMESIQRSAVENEDEDKEQERTYSPLLFKNKLRKPTSKPKPSRSAEHESTERPHDKYSELLNAEHDRSGRTKRAASRITEERNTCSMYVETDPYVWQHITQQVGNDPEKTREEILSLVAHHVTAVNYIYRDTKFDGRIPHRNIKFEVQRIKIDDFHSCTGSKQSVKNPFCLEHIDVSNFLNLHSLGNHEAFCLAYVFTYRDFTGGTLGLAWVASSAGASGGICEKHKTYTETIGGLYQSTKRSLNTGIITFVNYNTRVPPKVSQLTLAHEIGHNFGSPHDYPSDCRPGGFDGNYIMFASATSGDRPNNSKFSSCSIHNISSVLDSIEDNKKRNCFESSKGAFCGNKIVEEGEECDCGYDDDECLEDKCCYPRVVSERDRQLNGSAVGCARRVATECSPSQGPCCIASTCQFIKEKHRNVCKTETECSYHSYCNGSSAMCPTPVPKENKLRCNQGTQLCMNGECSGSICIEWGMQECFLSSNTYPPVDKRRLCEVACVNHTSGSICRSSSEFASSVGLPPGGLSLRPGSPCDNYQGYCDVFLRCRAVDAEGPLLRIRNMVLNKRLFIQNWMLENWPMCIIIAVSIIIILGLFVKCLAVHTPSSNPKKPPAQHFSDTLRNPMSTLRRMRPQHDGNGHRGRSANYRGGAPSRGGGGARQHRSPRAPAQPAANSGNPYAQRNVLSQQPLVNLAPPPPYSKTPAYTATQPSAPPYSTRADVYPGQSYGNHARN